jgi:hypothetical protein
MIEWPDLKFPPINLRSYPMVSFKYDRSYKRWRDMYCAAEIENYFRKKTQENLTAWETAGREFDKIYAKRAEHWEHI